MLLPLPLLLLPVLCVALSLIVLTDAVRVWWPSLFVPLSLPPLLPPVLCAVPCLPPSLHRCLTGARVCRRRCCLSTLRPADGAMVWGSAGVAADVARA